MLLLQTGENNPRFRLRDFFEFLSARPVFLVRPQDQKTSLNGVVNFQCMASGSPKPNIYWTKEGNQANLMFPNNTYGRIHIDHSGVLSIAGVKKEDEGFYVCSALSAIGEWTLTPFFNLEKWEKRT